MFTINNKVCAQASLEEVISLGPWGGLGGDHWRFRASNGITEIVLRVEGIIKSISFKDASGLFSGTFGARGNKPKTRGSRKKYLKSISGTYGSYKGQLVITSLSFITNLTTHGPFGTTTASCEPFSIPIGNSNVVVFHGRCGYYLDALGININSLSFRDGNDQEYGKFGGNNPKDPGEERKIVIDGHLKHLTSITGTYGDYNGLLVITSLSFKTNLTTYGPFGTATDTSFSIPIEGSVVIGFHGRGGCYLATYGPFGTGSGTSFSIPINNNTVVGFHGRGGHYIDAIGIFVKPKTTI
ncbi:hypothetical protein LguiB_018146 [Lonicera macranthoides]